MSDSIVLNKSEKFAIRIVKLYQFLEKKNAPVRLREQIVGSGTSIGANLSEAMFGISNKDFLAKAFISKKECSETMYWLRLFHETQYITTEQFYSLYTDAQEIMRILQSITKTMSKKIKTQTH